jgi:hypothetical protein
MAAQSPSPKSLLGTVSALRAVSAELDVRTDAGEVVPVKTASSTIVRKIGPGQTDLSKAESIDVTDVVIGDHVLVTFGAPDPAEARRIVVIPAGDIAKKAAADRADWQHRGMAGVVTAITGNDVSVELRSLGGVTKFTVTVGPKTTFKRYAPDSVRFADAKDSNLAAISAGDQIRAPGQKTPDGTKIEAEDIVFGTFLSKAGTISAVNPASHELTLKDLATNKPLVVNFVAESRVRRMPDVATLQTMLKGRGDIGQTIDSLPSVTLEDLKPGEVAVVSAIKGAEPDGITAMTFLANAETLVQLAMAARGAGASGPAPSLAGLASSISSVAP